MSLGKYPIQAIQVTWRSTNSSVSHLAVNLDQLTCERGRLADGFALN